MNSCETTSDYWDCECLKKYIHSIEETQCEICGAERDEMPDSRVNEVEEGSNFHKERRDNKPKLNLGSIIEQAIRES